MCVHTAVERSDNLSCWSWFYHVWVRVFPVVCCRAAHASLTSFPLPSSQECWGVSYMYATAFMCVLRIWTQAIRLIRKYNFLFCIILLSIVTVQTQWTLLKAGVWMTTKCLPQQKISSDLMAFHQVERRGNTKSSVRKSKEAIYHNNHWESYNLPTKASMTTNISKTLWSIRVSGTRP